MDEQLNHWQWLENVFKLFKSAFINVLQDQLTTNLSSMLIHSCWSVISVFPKDICTSWYFFMICRCKIGKLYLLSQAFSELFHFFLKIATERFKELQVRFQSFSHHLASLKISKQITFSHHSTLHTLMGVGRTYLHYDAIIFLLFCCIWILYIFWFIHFCSWLLDKTSVEQKGWGKEVWKKYFYSDIISHISLQFVLKYAWSIHQIIFVTLKNQSEKNQSEVDWQWQSNCCCVQGPILK